jgi:hypothetical protein
MKLLIGSGSRDYKSPRFIRTIFKDLLTEFGMDFEYYHGGQVGFDQYSDFVLRRFGFPYTRITPFYADWDRYDKAAGPIRNKLMLDTGLEKYAREDILVVAFPLPSSIGTYRMVEYAQEMHVETRIYKER